MTMFTNFYDTMVMYWKELFIWITSTTAWHYGRGFQLMEMVNFKLKDCITLNAFYRSRFHFSVTILHCKIYSWNTQYKNSHLTVL